LASLSPSQLARYARHVSLPEVGPEGQAHLRDASVLIVGAGGLGSPAALYLAGAGVGTIGMVDFDVVEVSNLQRQILHGVSQVGRPKVDSAAARLSDLNPEVAVETFSTRLTSETALAILGRFDLTIDGSDNFPTRYLVNDASVLLGKPFVSGSIDRFAGQISVFGVDRGPCYRCLFPEPPPRDLVPNCAVAGVLGVVPGIVGTLQATEAIKLILGIGAPLVGRILLYDTLAATVREVTVGPDPSCAVCGDRPTVTALIDYQNFCGEGSGGAAATEITAPDLARRREADPPIAILDIRDEWEWEIGRIAGARHIPLPQLADRLGELDARTEVVTARQVLAAAGFRARTLRGGIDAWAADVDPSVPRY